MNRIFVKEESETIRHYYANWSLSKQVTSIIYAGGATKEDIVKDHGEKGAALFTKLYMMASIPSFNFTLLRGNLTIVRSPAVEWAELEPKILSAIKEICGEFELKRESPLKRTVSAFSRLFKD